MLRPLHRPIVVSALLLAAMAAPTLAQGQSQGLQPLRYARGCRMLVPADAPYLQPKRLKPEEVQAKNAGGCLSQADAVYGPDGCPIKLCPSPTGMGL
ncbi:MAG: hypothetical protein WCK64_00310 [Synechococcaceae cyanobacterium ELA445]